MAKLPIIDQIADELYSAAERYRSQDNRRDYLGMSQIGKSCQRSLWLDFRGYKAAFDGRILMIFRFGDIIEDDIIFWLKQAGYKIEGQQEGFKAHGGFFRGHCDGIIHGITQRPHILEIKSCNDKKFKEFKKKGVKATNPTYYCQSQCYMGYSGLERALFVIQNKNTSEIYTERIPFITPDFEQLHKRAYDIITANDIPQRPFKENSFQCRWCSQKIICWYPEEAILSERVCGNCHFLRWKALKKYCSHPMHPYEVVQWGICCKDWVDMFEKSPVEAKRISLNKLGVAK